MQSAPGFPSDLTSAEVTAVVRIDGVEVEFDEVDVTSELESAMPAQVAAGGGAVVASTGNLLLIVSDSGGLSVPANPWGSNVPAQGSRVEIEAGYDGRNVRVFTGVTDGTSGDSSDSVVSLGLIDSIDRLDKQMSMPPLLSTWPSLSDGSWNYRRVGLSPLYFTNRALRSAGVYTTPLYSGRVIFAAQMVGSAWPEVGEVVTAHAQTQEDAGAAFRAVPWGVALGNGTMRYTPDLSVGSGLLDGVLQMVFNLNVRDTASGSITWDLCWGNDVLRIGIISNGNIVAQVRPAGGEYETVATLPRSAFGTSDTFAVRWLPSGNVTIYASNGANVTATSAIPTNIKTTAMTHILVNVPQVSHNLGGLQVTYSTFAFHNWKRDAVLTAPASQFGQYEVPSVPAFPALNGTSAELLKEQAEAELAAMWFDEYGTFRWVNRTSLTGTSPVGTLTSMENLLELAWEIPAKSVYSGIKLNSLLPTITRRSFHNISLYQGSQSNLDNLDEENLFIEPPSEESWFMVDNPTRANNVIGNSVRQGRGSIIGGVLTDDGQADRLTTWAEFNQSWSQINPQRWLLKSKAVIGSTAQVETRLLEATQYGKYSGADLPIIRGKAKARWEENTVTGAQRGPSGGAELQHDVGPWVQDQTELQGLADWLSERLTRTEPILRDVPIVPDPRIQKGDVFWLQDDSVYQLRLKVVVMGTRLSISAGPPVSMEQSITCRVIESARLSPTLAEHDQVWAADTLKIHDDFWAGATLAQHDADPLLHP